MIWMKIAPSTGNIKILTICSFSAPVRNKNYNQQSVAIYYGGCCGGVGGFGGLGVGGSGGGGGFGGGGGRVMVVA